MSKLSNELTMIQLLNSGKKYSISELAKMLEVSDRMIRLYKDDLEKAGIYVDTIMGPYGGYVLNQTIRVPERKFKKCDYELLDRCIRDDISSSDKEKIELLRDKIRGIFIGSKEEERELNLSDEILKRYNLLTRAIKQRKKVKILYYSYNTGLNERIICPAEMFLFKDGWYCAAYCELRCDIRHFELKRISEIELLEDKF